MARIAKMPRRLVKYGRKYDSSAKVARGVFGIGMNVSGIFRKKGLAEINKAMNETYSMTADTVSEAFFKFGQRVLETASLEEAPVDTGALSQSGFVVSRVSGGQLRTFTILGGEGSKNVGESGMRFSHNYQRQVMRRIKEKAVGQAISALNLRRDGFRVYIGFGAEYALFVHDRYDNKFLERALSRHLSSFRGSLEKYVSRRVSTIVGKQYDNTIEVR